MWTGLVCGPSPICGVRNPVAFRLMGFVIASSVGADGLTHLRRADKTVVGAVPIGSIC